MSISDVLDLEGGYIFDETTKIYQEEGRYSENQKQTKDTFSYKWEKRDTYDNEILRKNTKEWLMKKYFDNDEALYYKIFHENAVVLDAGCGAAFSAECLLGADIDKINYIGVDISDAVKTAYDRLNGYGYNMDHKYFIQCDLNHIPLNNKVDVIFSEGVLHHTDSTEKAIYNLSQYLNTGGYFLFYVYAKKGPIREFTDDYIRDYFKNKSNDETWEELRALTKFGKMLGDLNLNIDIDEDIPFLNIKKGSINLQRFFYWNIFKCFYHENYTIEEMNHINFDWYRPLNCHRQTPEQVEMWCNAAGLKVQRMCVEEAGISVVAEKLN